MLFQRYIFLVCLLLINTQLSAATTPIFSTNPDDGSKTLLGFNDIDINGVSHNVWFSVEPFYRVFGVASGTGIDFTTYSDASQATLALAGAFDLFPEWDNHTAGSLAFTDSGETDWIFLTPYIESPLYFVYLKDGPDIDAIYNGSPSTFGTADLYNRNLRGPGMLTNVVWADWSIAPTIPIPASVWLFGSGLIGLIGVARRKVRY